MPGGLLNDLYEVTMAASYLRRGLSGPATFRLFLRDLPPGRGFLISCGLADCLSFLEDYRFDDTALWALERLRFTSDVRAVPQGRVVFAGEPLLEVTAPIAEGQLVETVLLNHISFQIAIATKAERCVQAAGGAQVVDFAFRRTQGIDAALAVARASYIAGFAGTSNVEAARRYGIPATGTMAHSYIEASPDEDAAFAAFTADFPDRTTLLVDTYDTYGTIGGIKAAIRAARRAGQAHLAGIRIDSGDLGALAVQARRLLDREGMTLTRTGASGGLDEYRIAELTAARAPIDVYGVGVKWRCPQTPPSPRSVTRSPTSGLHHGGRDLQRLGADDATLSARNSGSAVTASARSSPPACCARGHRGAPAGGVQGNAPRCAPPHIHTAALSSENWSPGAVR